MVMISTAMVAGVAQKFEWMGLAGRERLLDEVITSQPEPAGSVLALSRMGLPAHELDHVLHVLFVIAKAGGGLGIRTSACPPMAG